MDEAETGPATGWHIWNPLAVLQLVNSQTMTRLTTGPLPTLSNGLGRFLGP